MYHKFKNLVRGFLGAKLPDIDYLPPAHLSAHLRADVGLFTDFESTPPRQNHLLGGNAGLWR
jgi:hypothetical protein